MISKELVQERKRSDRASESVTTQVEREMVTGCGGSSRRRNGRKAQSNTEAEEGRLSSEKADDSAPKADSAGAKSARKEAEAATAAARAE